MTHDARRHDLRRRSLRHRPALLPLDACRLRLGLAADTLLDALDLIDCADAAAGRGEAQRVISALLAASAAACSVEALGDLAEEELRRVFEARRAH